MRQVRWCRFAAAAGLVLWGPALSAQAKDAEPAACSSGATTIRGVVRRLDGASVSGVPVSIGWNVLLLQGLAVRTERCERRAVSAADGSFTATGVPDDESLLLVAAGPDGDVGVALRHEAGTNAPSPLTVYLPAVSDVQAAGPAATGKACRSRGRVVNAAGQPVVGARVKAAGSDVVRTDPQGAFDAPACGTDGTTFDIRGLNVARGEWWVGTEQPPSYWAISLDRPLPRLDAVIVTAPRREFVDVTGFEQRRRGAFGRFVTRADIEQRMPLRVQFMLEGLPGVQVSPSGQVMLSRNMGLGCTPNVFVDGQNLLGFDLNLIDPQTVYGIEVYRGATDTPAQFQPVGRGGCGAVVIWTRRGIDMVGPGR